MSRLKFCFSLKDLIILLSIFCCTIKIVSLLLEQIRFLSDMFFPRSQTFCLRSSCTGYIGTVLALQCIWYFYCIFVTVRDFIPIKSWFELWAANGKQQDLCKWSPNFCNFYLFLFLEAIDSKVCFGMLSSPSVAWYLKLDAFEYRILNFLQWGIIGTSITASRIRFAVVGPA